MLERHRDRVKGRDREGTREGERECVCVLKVLSTIPKIWVSQNLKKNKNLQL